MSKRKILLLVFIAAIATLLVISACRSEAILSSIETSSTSTINQPSLPTKTKTRIPTRTSLPTKTPTNTSTVVFPKDFDVLSIITVTPATPAQCPEVNTEIQIDIDSLFAYFQYEEESRPGELLMDVFISYLNQGVPIETLISTIKTRKENEMFVHGFTINDITGDGVEELIFSNAGGLQVIGCYNKRYMTYSTIKSPNMGVVINYNVLDVNQDNLLDIAILFSGCMGGKCPSYHIFSWNGHDFYSLNPHDCQSTYHIPFKVKLDDIDNNGTYEFILQYEKGHYPDGVYGVYPLRTEEITCMWNGIEYLTVNIEYGPPIYRFQAASDAGGQLFYGNNEEALALYQQTIDDPSLEWYTDDRNVEAYWNYVSDYWGGVDVDIPPLDNLEPNPDEYDNLAAYAYFRIIMVHLLQDDVSTAETVFEEMVEKYPVGCKQSLLAESAEIMLDSYKHSEDIHATCTEVVKFVKPRQDELFKLYDYFYWAGISSPPGLCPYWEGDYTSY